MPIQSSEDFKDWVGSAPLAWQGVLAVRIALRVLPLIGTNESVRLLSPAAILDAFHASFISWASTVYINDNLKTYCRFASSGANLAARSARAVNIYPAAAAISAVSAAANAMSATASAENPANATLMFAISATNSFSNAEEALSQILKSIDDDVDWLNTRVRSGDAWLEAQSLAKQRLWLSDVRGDPRYTANIPIWARGALDQMASNSILSEAGFEHWFTWYRKLIPSRVRRAPESHFGSPLDVRIARQSKTWWDRSPEKVNADIAVWIGGGYGVDPEEKRPTIRQFILDYLSTRTTPASVPEINKSFADANYPVIPKSVRGQLSYLATEGKIRRVSLGYYEAVGVGQGEPPELIAQGSGHQFLVQDGRVDAGALLPTASERTDPTQVQLLDRLRRKLALFSPPGSNFDGQYPILADAIAEYRAAIENVPIAELDVAQVWMAGTGLISQARAFAALDPSKQVTNPLEPEKQGLLAECARLHGAFVMGFDEGRKLAERSQVPLLSKEELHALLQHEQTIVRWLLANNEFELSDKARSVFEQIDRMYVVGSEGFEELALVGYPAIRNLLILTGHAGRYIELVAGRMALVGVPVHLAVPGLIAFLTQNLAPIAGVTSSLPELNMYFQWLYERLGIRYDAEQSKERNR